MKKYLTLIVILISIATVFSGLAQVIAPAFVLNIVGGEIRPATTHFFSIIGMFMFLFGGMMLHAVYSPFPNKTAVLWASFQKFGAAIAVGLGIWNGIFSTLAGSVAIFDLASGIIIFYYFITLKTNEAH